MMSFYGTATSRRMGCSRSRHASELGGLLGTEARPHPEGGLSLSVYLSCEDTQALRATRGLPTPYLLRESPCRCRPKRGVRPAPTLRGEARLAGGKSLLAVTFFCPLPWVRGTDQTVTFGMTFWSGADSKRESSYDANRKTYHDLTALIGVVSLARHSTEGPTSRSGSGVGRQRERALTPVIRNS